MSDLEQLETHLKWFEQGIHSPENGSPDFKRC